MIVVYMGILMLIGLIVMYAIGPSRANVLNQAYGTDFYTGTYFFVKQSASLAIAVVAFILMAKIPYSLFFKHAGKILMVGFIACFLLLVFGNLFHVEAIAQCSLGACRWFSLGPFGSLQPAELLKFGMLLFLAGFLGLRYRQGLINDINKTLVPVGALMGAIMLFVIIFEKDMGTGIVMSLMVLAMLVATGMKWKIIASVVGVVVLLGVLMIVTSPHRMERITTFFKGDSTAVQINDENYHIKHAKIAIGTGGIMGVGIGNSVEATGYLPEAINDSIFAIMGETFGFVGLVAILLLFTALLMRILKVSDHMLDPSLRLLVVGIFTWLGAHVIINVAAMTGVFPLTGITLPLLSFGGSSMLFMAAALGLAFQLSRYSVHGSKLKEISYEDSSSGRGIGRSRDTRRRSSQRAA
ncbi:MAG: FtsW/RodA/SpoVE family cell cycle protein [bacterium]|nr:FtsW/RodA/SpoVE family cell cycle protein [bacterium]